MNDELNRDSWRQHYLRLTLILDQASAFCSLGNFELARERIGQAKGLVDGAQKQLETTAEKPPHFMRESEVGSSLNANEIAMVGPLTESIAAKDAATRQSGRAALTSLLNQIRYEDRYQLNVHQRKNLYLFLQMENAVENAELMIAILQALATMRDTDAIRPVHRLAASEAYAKQCKRVRAVAENCRDILETVKAREELNESLLRPSGNPENHSSLLRPATSSDGTDSTLLLHSSSEQID